MDRDESRQAALELAVELHKKERFWCTAGNASLEFAQQQVLETAEAIYDWQPRISKIVIHVGQVAEQGDPLHPLQDPVSVGGSVLLTDTQQVDLTADPEDAKGFDVDAQLVWTATAADGGDASATVTLNVSADTKTCTVVAGNPGSALVLATVGDKSGSVAVDVSAGALDHINLIEGTPTEQGA